MKVSVLALLAAPVVVLASFGSHSNGAGVAHHHQNVARGVKAHPASHFKKRGPAKARHCAARIASISSASVSSTSVLAHETTTTKKPDPTTTTTKEHHTTTTTEKPKPTQNDNNNNDNNNNDNSGSSGGETFTGDGTFYSTGLNACGTYDNDSDFIAALAHGAFDSYPGANGNSNENPICNKKVRACRTSNGKCVTVRITDRCGGCVGHALDFSPSAFEQMADFSVGRFHDLEWHYL